MAEFKCDACGTTYNSCFTFTVCPYCMGFGKASQYCTCKRWRTLAGKQLNIIKERNFSCPVHGVRVGSWVKVKEFPMSPDKIRRINVEEGVFFADFITEGGGCSEWLEPISIKNIESIIADPKEIEALEEELDAKPMVYFDKER